MKKTKILNPSIILELKGSQIFIEKNKFYMIQNEDFFYDKSLFLNKIISFSTKNNFFVGTPYLKNIKIKVKIINQFLEPKIITYKMKPKKGSKTKSSSSKKLIKFLIEGIFIKKN